VEALVPYRLLINHTGHVYSEYPYTTKTVHP